MTVWDVEISKFLYVSVFIKLTKQVSLHASDYSKMMPTPYCCVTTISSHWYTKYQILV